jgi:hypothetical protein
MQVIHDLVFFPDVFFWKSGNLKDNLGIRCCVWHLSSLRLGPPTAAGHGEWPSLAVLGCQFLGGSHPGLPCVTPRMEGLFIRISSSGSSQCIHDQHMKAWHYLVIVSLLFLLPVLLVGVLLVLIFALVPFPFASSWTWWILNTFEPWYILRPWNFMKFQLWRVL